MVAFALSCRRQRRRTDGRFWFPEAMKLNNWFRNLPYTPYVINLGLGYNIYSHMKQASEYIFLTSVKTM